MLVGGVVRLLGGAFVDVDTRVWVFPPRLGLCKPSVSLWVWSSE